MTNHAVINLKYNTNQKKKNPIFNHIWVPKIIGGLRQSLSSMNLNHPMKQFQWIEFQIEFCLVCHTEK